MTKRLEYALAFAEKGFLIVPQDRSKKPCLTDWPEKATSDPEQIKAWATEFPKANFAAMMGPPSDMIGMDIDVKNGQPGRDSYNRLVGKFGDLNTVTTRTPSMGGHKFLKWNGMGRLKNQVLSGYPGIEIKAFHALMTLPGSI